MMPHLGPQDWWIIAIGAACAAACALVGCYLVLRRMALLGDAISHAVLPGLAAAFMLSGTRDIGVMLIGAAASALITAVLSAALSRFGRVPEDAAMGVVFTSLFALGVIMVNRVGQSIDLDPGCVLYGLIELTPLDTVKLAGIEAPRAALWMFGALIVNAGAYVIFFKEIRIVAFDAALATTMGLSATAIHAGMLALVAGTTVVSFEAVGSILVVAMLIAPPAAAHLLTDRFSRMLWISAALGAASSVIGYLLSLHFNTSVAGMMSVAAGGLFVCAALLSPRHGLFTRAAHRAALALRIREEDALGMLFRRVEQGQGMPGVAEVHLAAGGGLMGRLAAWNLRRRRYVQAGDGVELTERGMARARELVRSHRLWESFLATEVGLPIDHLHEPSHRVEHFLGQELTSRLRGALDADVDPQGKKIP